MNLFFTATQQFETDRNRRASYITLRVDLIEDVVSHVQIVP